MVMIDRDHWRLVRDWALGWDDEQIPAVYVTRSLWFTGYDQLRVAAGTAQKATCLSLLAIDSMLVQGQGQVVLPGAHISSGSSPHHMFLGIISLTFHTL